MPREWHGEAVVAREKHYTDCDEEKDRVELVHAFLEDDLIREK
jgi:hypothetical protein